MLRIGVDLGGTKTEGVVMDVSGEILLRERRATPQADGYSAILTNLHDLVRELEQRAGDHCHVGIGMPGAISTRTGFVKNSNAVCLNGRPVKQDLENMLAREIRIANDANCFALSEAIDGAAQGAPVVFGVILGTGVGGGIVVNGRLIEGAQHTAGEWGHNVLEPDGPPCYCGKHGCVETFLSGPGLAHDFQRHGGAQRRASGRMPGADGDSAWDARAIDAAAARSDPLAEAAMLRYLDRFGRALSVVVNILDPDVIVLGGGLSNMARLYTDGRESLAAHTFNDELRTVLLPHRHGDSSGVRGAARLWQASE